MARSKKIIDQSFLPEHFRRAPKRPAGAGESPAVQAIWNVIAMIPRGQTSTYGDVARAAGYPGRARLTGYALRIAPQEMRLPWQRVLGAGARIVFPASSRQYREQARLLRSEGLQVRNGRVATEGFA